MFAHLVNGSFNYLTFGEGECFFFLLGIVLALLKISECLFNGFPTLRNDISALCDKRITATTDFSRTVS